MLANAAIEIAESDLITKPVPKPDETPSQRAELTPIVEHQLEVRHIYIDCCDCANFQQMMKSAMFHTVSSRSDIVSTASVSSRESRSSDSMGREALLAAAIEEALHNPQDRVNSCGSDEDFCIVDEIPGSGITVSFIFYNQNFSNALPESDRTPLN
jgi:hypothetical protein